MNNILKSITATAVLCWRVVPAAGILLLPYLAWIRFATVLDLAVVAESIADLS